jgi:hypothetical protein
MAAPILQFKRGTTVPGSIFNAAEPVYNISSKILYLGDSGGTGTGSGSAIASATAYAAASEILVKSVASTSAGQVLLKDAQASQNTLTFGAPATVTSSYSFTLPAAVPAGASGYFMTSNTSGDTSWSQVGISVVTGLGANVAAFLGTPSSANLASAVTDETGTGALVFATSPSLVTPLLGTPTSGTLTNCTGLPIATGVSGLGTGAATFLATPSSANLASLLTDETGTGANVFATSPTLVSPLLGTPTSGTLTNCTGLPVASGISGLGTGVATFLATPSSANLASAVTGETGTGALVFGTSPSLTTPALAGETFSTTNNVTAGTNAQGQGALTTDINVITTAAAAPSGVTLPTATTGRRIVIVNKGANAVNVYPATGATIDALAVNTAISLPVNGLLEFNASSTTQWYSSFNSSITGTGVTTFSAGTTGLTPNSATTGAITLGGTLAVANGGTGVTTSTGSGSTVRNTSPSFVTPLLGTPTSGTLTNCTGLPISTGVSGLAANVATFLATPSSANLALAVTNETGSGSLVFATSPTLVTPLLGTPTSGTLTNCTGLPIATGVSGLAANVATFLATPSSANLAAVLTDETGTGANVFGTSPTITTSLLAASSAFDLLNTTATTINFAGAATTLTVGNTTTAGQAVNMFTASTGASTYNFATGATANAITKAINIGTNGVAGSTTNINIGSSAGTSTTTVNGNLTVGGNLTVSGNTTILNTQTIQVEDRFIELGLVNGAAPASATTWDTAIGFNYFATTAKKSGIVWLDNAGFALASELAVASGDTGTTAADPQLSVTTLATLAVGNLYVGALGTATNEVINSSKQVINVTIDCGTY